MGIENVVQLTVAGVELFPISYRVEMSVLQVPNIFQATVKLPGPSRDMWKRFPPRSPFALRVAGRTQFEGLIDSRSMRSDSGGTILSITGRDPMAEVFDACVQRERSIKAETIAQFVEIVVRELYASATFTFSNDARRERVAGAVGTSGSTTVFSDVSANPFSAAFGAAILAGPSLPGAATVAGTAGGGFTATTTITTRSVQAKIGQKYYQDLIKPELDRSGLCLWSDTGTKFILAAPNPNQKPIARLQRRLGGVDTANVRVLYGELTDSTTGRYAGCDVHFRSGGGDETIGKGFGTYDDLEMQRLGFTKRLTKRDDKCTSLAQATAFARRSIAAQRRSGFSLIYEIAGHTLKGFRGEDVVIGPDVVIEVDDEELGVSGTFWVDSITAERSGRGTTTQIRLMRPEDVVFGAEGAA